MTQFQDDNIRVKSVAELTKDKKALYHNIIMTEVCLKSIVML